MRESEGVREYVRASASVYACVRVVRVEKIRIGEAYATV